MTTPSPLAPPRHVWRTQVYFFDTDCGGVVHNLAYLRWIEAARTHLVEELGMDLRAMAAEQKYPVLVRTEIDYARPALLNDLVEVDGILERCSRARFWVAFEVRRPADGTVLVRCRQTLALVQMPSGRPLPAPAAWRTDGER